VGDAQVPDYRDGRDEPGHDQVGAAASFAPVTENARQIALNLRIRHCPLSIFYIAPIRGGLSFTTVRETAPGLVKGELAFTMQP